MKTEKNQRLRKSDPGIELGSTISDWKMSLVTIVPRRKTCPKTNDQKNKAFQPYLKLVNKYAN